MFIHTCRLLSKELSNISVVSLLKEPGTASSNSTKSELQVRLTFEKAHEKAGGASKGVYGECIRNFA